MDMANDACQMSGVHVDVLDVGGGFPVPYLGCNPPPFSQFVDKIQAHSNGRAVWCEPGRALVAAGEALVVRVVSRKGDALFLNDGIYGGLAPAPLSGYRYASQLITNDGRTASTSKQSFQLFGPTCDSWDCLPVPYDLPVNCAEGDWIVMFGTGAYAGAIRTRFNGMGTARTLTLSS
jgi:ornithine decarboxylase